MAKNTCNDYCEIKTLFETKDEDQVLAITLLSGKRTSLPVEAVKEGRRMRPARVFSTFTTNKLFIAILFIFVALYIPYLTACYYLH